MQLNFSLGWNRVVPSHRLGMNSEGFVQCSVLQNFISRNKKIAKVGGTTRYNPSIMPGVIPYVKRSYHRIGDISFAKRFICYSNGGYYYDSVNLIGYSFWNQDFEAWTLGAALAPDNWTLGGAGATIARESVIIKSGVYSAKLTSAAADATLQQDIQSIDGIAYWKGKTVRVDCWVYASVNSTARITLNDGVGSTNSSWHTGSSTWERLSLTRVVDSSATQALLTVTTLTGTNTAYFDRMDITVGDGNRTMALALGGLNVNAIPLDVTFQVSGNSILYLFNGKDVPYKYDGNGSYSFEKTTLDKTVMAGVEHLTRIFYIKENSSDLDYSATLDPETIEDTILIGNALDSVNLGIVRGANDTLYIFKNNSIYELMGRTPSSFQLRCVTDKYGLANKRAICAVGSGFVFLNSFDKELYFFGGSESSIMNLTEAEIKLREIINTTDDAITNACMCVHDGLFRFAFQHRESFHDVNNCELVYCITEPKENGLPKWSLIKGTNVLSYSVWNQQGDNNELVTGRSDFGYLMRHNQGWDFDGNAIETDIRTAEIVLSEDMEVQVLDFFIKAKPSAYNINTIFSYYLNERFSDGGITNLSMRGETRDVGSIHISKGSILNDRIVPLRNYCRGNSISFRLYDNSNGTNLEYYSIAFKSIPKYRIRNQYV